MSKVYCIGEALIDFVSTSHGLPMEDVPGFVRAAGGAPANLAAAVKKLGAESCFIGKLGDDAFGRHIKETIDKAGVDTTYLYTTREAFTTLCFVALHDSGERDMIFARKPGADMLLSEEDVANVPFGSGDIMHFGSCGLVEGPTRRAHKKAVELAKKAGCIVSFDPNVRLDLWEDPRELRDIILEFLPFADVLKVNSEEVEFIFGSEDEKAAAKKCLDMGIRLVLVTRGPAGSAMYTKEHSTEIRSIDVPVDDTTGAGDAYTGTVLSMLVGHKLEEVLKPEKLEEIIRLANIVGSITTMKKGAIESIPTLEEAKAFPVEQYGLV